MESKIVRGNEPFAEAVRSLERWQLAEKRGEAWVARNKRDLARLEAKYPALRPSGRKRSRANSIEQAENRLRLLEIAAGI